MRTDTIFENGQTIHRHSYVEGNDPYVVVENGEIFEYKKDPKPYRQVIYEVTGTPEAPTNDRFQIIYLGKNNKLHRLAVSYKTRGDAEAAARAVACLETGVRVISINPKYASDAEPRRLSEEEDPEMAALEKYEEAGISYPSTFTPAVDRYEPRIVAHDKVGYGI